MSRGKLKKNSFERRDTQIETWIHVRAASDDYLSIPRRGGGWSRLMSAISYFAMPRTEYTLLLALAATVGQSRRSFRLSQVEIVTEFIILLFC